MIENTCNNNKYSDLTYLSTHIILHKNKNIPTAYKGCKFRDNCTLNEIGYELKMLNLTKWNTVIFTGLVHMERFLQYENICNAVNNNIGYKFIAQYMKLIEHKVICMYSN